jgi:hypothetical protein
MLVSMVTVKASLLYLCTINEATILDNALALPKTIGTLREKSLHAALKQHYTKPDDDVEARFEGYSIDIKRGTGKRTRLIEIQTRSFSSIKAKLTKLLPRYKITLVHPIAQEKWIVRYDEDGVLLSRRRSPKRGCVEDVFKELLRLPALALHPNLRIEIVLTREEEVQRTDGKGSWRRKGHSIFDRRLLEVVRVQSFTSAKDWMALLPSTLPNTFTNQELARALSKPNVMAARMTYCLKHMGLLELVGKRGRANVFGKPLK